MKIIAFLLSLFMVALCSAQTIAVTNSGDQVALNNDGTWNYIDKNDTENDEIRLSKTKFEKNDYATFLVKSAITKASIYIDPRKWTFAKGKNSEYEFRLKGKDVYGMLLSERVEVPLASLKSIALENARTAAPDTRIMKEEYRMVNGNKVLCLQMEGTIHGLRFSYMGYYYSDAKGTLQFVTYTGQNLLKEYISDMEQFLNGLIVTKIPTSSNEL